MEKKTIGQFISVLRKANGMTQKELAEKLYVSDKTVSRWECDESTPDLALIPVLAEIFQITTDELLRGERKNPEKEGDDGGRYALKSEKAWKNLLYTRKKKYDTLTFISLGLSIGGWLVGILCNFAFYNGVLGFVLGTIFLLASQICQICFMRNYRLPIDEEGWEEEILQNNAYFIKRLIQMSWINYGLFACTLPLAMAGGSAGLAFEAWLGFSAIFCAVALAIGYIVYTVAVEPFLLRNHYLIERTKNEKRRKNIRRMSKIAVWVIGVALCLGAGIFTVNMLGYQKFLVSEIYTDVNAFIERMQGDYDQWFEEGYGDLQAGEEYESYKKWGVVYTDEGEMLTYYYQESLYKDVDFWSGKKLPVEIVTTQAYYDAWDTFYMIQDILYFSILADVAIGFIIYVIIARRE